jgi:long-subunit fatty acid transport protein
MLVPVSVSAQQSIIPLQFSFSDPGARSMGFGGAFVALADDATAAFANPAGLVQLLRPEVSIEARNWSYSTPYTEGGRADGLPSGIGIDSTVGLITSTSGYDVTALSFLSVAYPQDNWSLALYRHVYADLEFYGETQGLFAGGTDCCQIRFYDQQMASQLDILAYGLSGAYRIGDRFDIGLGVVYTDASLAASTTLYSSDEDTTASYFAPNSYLPSRTVTSERQIIDDGDWSLSVGFLWRLSARWRIGGVYRQGAEVKVGTERIAGEVNGLGVPPGEVLLQASGVPLDFPDIFGLGFAYQSADGDLTVSFQWDRVEYSDIATSLELNTETVDDADELHIGAEYVFLDSTPITAVRLGAWYEPDHQVRTTANEPFARAMLPPGDDQMHYSAGLGFATERHIFAIRDLQLLGDSTPVPFDAFRRQLERPRENERNRESESEKHD